MFCPWLRVRSSSDRGVHSGMAGANTTDTSIYGNYHLVERWMPPQIQLAILCFIHRILGSAPWLLTRPSCSSHSRTPPTRKRSVTRSRSLGRCQEARWAFCVLSWHRSHSEGGQEKTRPPQMPDPFVALSLLCLLVCCFSFWEI